MTVGDSGSDEFRVGHRGQVNGAPDLRGGRLLLLVGPGGSGKTTLAEGLGRAAGMSRLLSYSTRAPRGQYPFVEYRHVDREAFGQLVAENRFVEIGAAASGTFYGFPFPETEFSESQLAAAKCLLGISSAVGAGIIRQRLAPKWDVKVMLVDASDAQVVTRLNKRGDTKQQILDRLLLAPSERIVLGGHDWRIQEATVNGALEQALSRISNWIGP